MSLFKKKIPILITFIILSFIGLFTVTGMLQNSKNLQIKQSQQLLIQESTAHFNTIKDLEMWHNKLGGVFKNTTNKEDYNFHIYSLNPKNKENQARNFAKDGLEFFVKNKNKEIFYNFGNKEKDFKFIGVLKTEKRCIQCHSNFSLGEVRGGIEVNVPLENYQDTIELIHEQFNTFTIFVLSFFIIGMLVITYFINLLFKEKEKVDDLNNSLELKVEDRTNEIKHLYSREHYLKKLLETISELNESLISTYSVTSLIKTSLETLKNHSYYKLIIFGNYDGEKFCTKEVFGDIYSLINKESYSKNDLDNDILLDGLKKTCLTNSFSINDKLKNFKFKNNTYHREEDYDITASISIPLIENNTDKSFDIITFYTSRDIGFDDEELVILKNVAKDIMMALSAYKQRKMTEQLQNDQIVNYEETILAFVDMIEQRDAYTAGHTLRVAKYSGIIAKSLHFDETQIRKIEQAAILHDIGKIATPDTILLKPGKLNILEYDLIKNHVSAGYKMLSKVKMYQELAEIIKYHHEHYDGTGYPNGYKGDEIPIEGHILIVADAFDAMTTNRIYKPRLSVDDTLAELVKHKGTQFHPKIVDIAIKELKNIELNETTQAPQTDLEKQRFSYFFNDSLTLAYNEAYLYLALSQMKSLVYVNIIKLRNFSEFNKRHNWKIGNKVLVTIVEQLISLYPSAKIFRVEGDDFIVISEDEISIDEESFSIKRIDKENIIQKEFHHFTISDEKEYYKFEKFIEIV